MDGRVAGGSRSGRRHRHRRPGRSRRRQQQRGLSGDAYVFDVSPRPHGSTSPRGTHCRLSVPISVLRSGTWFLMTPPAHPRAMATGAVRAVATLAAPRHGAFTRLEAASLGLSARNIATAKTQGWLFEPVPGVLVLAGSAPSWRRRLLVGVLAGKERSRASHRAASVPHGSMGSTIQTGSDAETSSGPRT